MLLFDRRTLALRPLSQRQHDLHRSAIMPLAPVGSPIDRKLTETARHIRAARERGASVIMMLGGHVVRSGVQRFVIDMLERGYVSCIAANGSVMIHDFELSLIGATTESVSRYISEGQFGLWQETGRLNDVINAAAGDGLGMGEAVGRAILEGDFPYKDTSILAACSRLGIPATIHVGIGYDIIHELPNCSGAATGETSYRDFLRFAKVVEGLEGGVVMNFGSAVMAPEVFLKALSMARNAAAHRHGASIGRFATLVCDLRELPGDLSREAPKNDPAYYFRPYKTMLVRTVADGGSSYYVRGSHAETIPALWSAVAILAENGA